MSEIVTITESEVRRTVAKFLRSKILELAAKQPVLRSECDPLYKSATETCLIRAATKYAERMTNRSELRALNLAYAFVRGVPYEKLERGCHEEAPFHRSLEHVLNFMFDGYNSKHKATLSTELRRWSKGEEQEFFKAKEAARAEAVPAVAE